MGLLKDFSSHTSLSNVNRRTKNISVDTDLIQKNLITMAKNLENQNNIIISRLDDICKMLYDLTKNSLNNNK